MSNGMWLWIEASTFWRWAVGITVAMFIVGLLGGWVHIRFTGQWRINVQQER